MTATHIIPTMRYKDASKAIEWLCSTWGFRRITIVENPDNTVAHAELQLDNIMIMLGSIHEGGQYDDVIVQPSSISNKETQAPYIVVENPDWFYNQAKRFGAKILIELKDEDYGGRGFTCADIENHIWNFGSYNPFKK